MMSNFKRPRPQFPKRAVITGGMPYGNKSLHFGHIGGVFVHADTFARFLKDRIGSDNVIFVSGTDCYGSPIIASYKDYLEQCQQNGENAKSLEDYVMNFHQIQKRVLDKYDVAPSLYAASAFGRSGEVHKEVSDKLFEALYDSGYLKKMSTSQFYDETAGAYLNGRQVIGQCPFDGCQSEKAYADECGLGHQYMPSELIEPKSTLSDSVPKLVDVDNWYFELDAYNAQLQKMVQRQRKERLVRPMVLNITDEFLKAPTLHITRKEFDKMTEQGLTLEMGTLIDEPKKPSVTYEFANLAQRDAARAILDANTIRYRTGKTLVPFRLSGNVDWGVPVPEQDGLKNLTFWVWPESLWAPISFTQTYLESIGKDKAQWRDWWLSDDAQVYQIIGEDNIYFYGIAEMGMLLAYLSYSADDERSLDDVPFPQLVANCHLQFMNTKASSSSEVKPPMAEELLEHYTAEQLRMYFLSLGLSKKGVSFNPKPYDPSATADEPDPVLKDGNLLTNVFNRIMRSAFYTAQKYTDSKIPTGTPSDEIVKLVEKDTLDYENHMYKQDFHRVIYTLDHIIRHFSKYWSKESRAAGEDKALLEQLLVDTFYGIRAILTLLHPIAPSSCENARKRLNLSDKIWSWQNILCQVEQLMDDPASHQLEDIPPKYDFFEKHPSQLANYDEDRS